MKAAVLYQSDQPMVIEERPRPAPGAGEVLIRIERCGICGSELHAFTGPVRQFGAGVVLGHEFAGEIVDIGTGVSGFRAGERVAVYPATGCGQCEACRRGNAILCPTARRLMGGFAEYAAIPAAAAVRLADGISAAQGALIEPLAVAYYGVISAPSPAGQPVLVLGAGPIALATLYWAKQQGASRLVAMSRSAERAAMTQALGADQFIAYSDNEVDAVREALGGPPAIVYECVGYPGFLGKAIAHADTFGTVVSLGFGTAPDPVIPAAAGLKDLTLRFPVGYSLDDFRHVANHLANGPVDPTAMITRVISLAELPQVFGELSRNNRESKVQVRCT